MNITTDVTWRRLRELVKSRDKAICFHCKAEDENGACDHLQPISRGGTDSIMNLVWSCKSCNSKKGNRITNDDYLEIVNKLDPTDEYPKFDKIFRSLLVAVVKYLIPPYPKYQSPHYFWNIEHYRETILKMRQNIVTAWLRDQIWTMPIEAKFIIDRSEEYKLYEAHQASFDWFTKRYPVCPECGKLAETMLSDYDHWLCPNSHWIKKEDI